MKNKVVADKVKIDFVLQHISNIDTKYDNLLDGLKMWIYAGLKLSKIQLRTLDNFYGNLLKNGARIVEPTTPVVEQVNEVDETIDCDFDETSDDTDYQLAVIEEEKSSFPSDFIPIIDVFFFVFCVV